MTIQATIQATAHMSPVYKMSLAEVVEEYEAMKLLKNRTSVQMRRMQHLRFVLTSPDVRRR